MNAAEIDNPHITLKVCMLRGGEKMMGRQTTFADLLEFVGALHLDVLGTRKRRTKQHFRKLLLALYQVTALRHDDQIRIVPIEFRRRT